MSTGIQVFKANGVLSYSTDEVTWNQVGVLYCPAGGSVSGVFPALAGKEVLLTQIPINPPSMTQKTYAHTVARTDTAVAASGGNTDAYILVLMR